MSMPCKRGLRICTGSSNEYSFAIRICYDVVHEATAHPCMTVLQYPVPPPNECKPLPSTRFLRPRPAPPARHVSVFPAAKRTPKGEHRKTVLSGWRRPCSLPAFGRVFGPDARGRVMVSSSWRPPLGGLFLVASCWWPPLLGSLLEKADSSW